MATCLPCRVLPKLSARCASGKSASARRCFNANVLWTRETMAVCRSHERRRFRRSTSDASRPGSTACCQSTWLSASPAVSGTRTSAVACRRPSALVRLTLHHGGMDCAELLTTRMTLTLLAERLAGQVIQGIERDAAATASSNPHEGNLARTLHFLNSVGANKFCTEYQVSFPCMLLGTARCLPSLPARLFATRECAHASFPEHCNAALQLREHMRCGADSAGRARFNLGRRYRAAG